jgi:hypothetical protein
MEDVLETAREYERIEADLRRAARLAEPAAPIDAAVALPRELMWSRGVIAWEWEVPLRRIGELDDPPPGKPLVAFVPRRWTAPASRVVATTHRWRAVVAKPAAAHAFGPRKRG